MKEKSKVELKKWQLFLIGIFFLIIGAIYSEINPGKSYVMVVLVWLTFVPWIVALSR